MFENILGLLKNARGVDIYRHINADYDALGAQYGLRQFLTDNFPHIHVNLYGQLPADLKTRMELPEWEREGEGDISVILDTANRERIDGEGFDQAKCLIKIDHHPLVDDYGDIKAVDSESSSTCEILGRMFLSWPNVKISAQTARYLFFGLIGDTNRFLYAKAPETFHLAGELLALGVDGSEVYEAMYLKDQRTLMAERYVLNHTRYEDGAAYFVLDEKSLNDLALTREEASGMVDLLGNVQDYEIWASVTYQKEAGVYRVSLRSRHFDVSKIAARFHGGGHRLASGATLKTLDDLPRLVKAMKETIGHAF